MHRFTSPLEVQQDPPGRVQGGGSRRGRGRHAGHRSCGQRRELLRRVEELDRPDEEPGGQVQRSEVRREERER